MPSTSSVATTNQCSDGNNPQQSTHDIQSGCGVEVII